MRYFKAQKIAVRACIADKASVLHVPMLYVRDPTSGEQMTKYKNRYITSFTVFFVLYFIVGYFISDLQCGDGWASSSIGRQGACSSHGGVVSVSAIPVFPAAIVISLMVFVLLSKFGKR
jgi:hypothetical protein